jgi:hypothetical protein
VTLLCFNRLPGIECFAMFLPLTVAAAYADPPNATMSATTARTAEAVGRAEKRVMSPPQGKPGA